MRATEIDSIRIAETHVGHGIFALRGFLPEECIGEVAGELIDDPDYGSDTCIETGDTQVLEPGPPFKYLNHSCNPNCELVVQEDDEGDWYVAVTALRAIAPGEELTIDYAWPADVAIPCQCHSANCRGWIVDPGEQHRLPNPVAG